MYYSISEEYIRPYLCKKISSLTKRILSHVFVVYEYTKYFIDIFVNKKYPSVSKLSSDTYVVRYFIDDREYKFIVKKHRGPRPFDKIVMKNTQEDVTNRVLPYMGPGFDWHKNHSDTVIGNRDAFEFINDFGIIVDLSLESF